MQGLGFVIEMRPHSDTDKIAWLVLSNGRRRRATPEELVMWQALEELSEGLEQPPGAPPEPEKVKKRR